MAQMLSLNTVVGLDNSWLSPDTDRFWLLRLILEQLFFVPCLKDRSDNRLRFISLLVPHFREMLVVQFKLFHADSINHFTKNEISPEVFLQQESRLVFVLTPKPWNYCPSFPVAIAFLNPSCCEVPSIKNIEIFYPHQEPSR